MRLTFVIGCFAACFALSPKEPVNKIKHSQPNIYMQYPKSRKGRIIDLIFELFKECKVLDATALVYQDRLGKLSRLLNRLSAEKDTIASVAFNLLEPLKVPSVQFKADLFALGYSCLFDGNKYSAENLKIIDQFYSENQKTFDKLLKEIVLPSIENKMILKIHRWLSGESSEIYKLIIAKAQIEGSQDSAEVSDAQYEDSQIQLNTAIEKNKFKMLDELLQATFSKEALDKLHNIAKKDLAPIRVEYRQETISPSLIQATAKKLEIEQRYTAFPSFAFNYEYNSKRTDHSIGLPIYFTLRGIINFLVGRKPSKDGIRMHLKHVLDVSKFKKKSLVTECQAHFKNIEDLEKRVIQLRTLYKDSIIKYRSGATYYDREYTPNLVYENLRKLAKAETDLVKAMTKFWEKLFELQLEEGVFTDLLTRGALGSKND